MGCCQSCCYTVIYFCEQFYLSYIRGRKNVQIVLGVIGGALLMVILLAIFGAFRSHCATCEPEDRLYYNVFSAGWAPAECRYHLAHNPNSPCIDTLPKDRLVIEQLAVQLYNSHTHLLNCSKTEEFDLSKLSSIKPKLDSNWPSLVKDRTNDALWAHQWNLHGKCSKFGLVDYFTKAIAVQEKYPFFGWLNASDIKPSETQSYQPSQLEDSFKKQGSLDKDYYTLVCVKVKNAAGAEVVILKDVRLCAKWSNPLDLVKCVPEQVAIGHNEFQCKDPLYLVDSGSVTVPPTTVVTTTHVPTPAPPTTAAPTTTAAPPAPAPGR